ncbi:MAG TPA: ATP-binding protein, partial [Pirellulales bacterium]|nr:ATP-binding protein [Pirellulales bacterium]
MTVLNSKEPTGYVAAIVASLALVALRVVLTPWLENEAPLLILLLAVAVAAGIGGFRPGLLATVLSAALGYYFLIVKADRLFALETSGPTQVIVFLCEGLLISILFEGLYRSRQAILAQQRMLEEQAVERERVAAALYEEQIRMQITLASIGDAVIATDLQGCVTFLNPIAQALTGWNQAAAMGQPLETIFQIVNEQTRAPCENSAQQALRNGTIVAEGTATILIAKDQTERPIDDSAAPIRNERGDVTGVVLVFRDVAERRRVERELAERTRILNLAAEIGNALTQAPTLQETLAACAQAIVNQFDNAAVAIWTWNRSAGVLDLQARAGCDSHRWDDQTRVEFNAGPIGQIAAAHHPLLLAAEGAERDAAFAGCPLYTDEQLVGVIALVAAPADGDLALRALGAVADEIAVGIERRWNERELAAREEQMRVALQAGKLGSWDLDVATRRLTASPECKANFGRPADAPFSYDDWLQCVHRDDRAEVEAELARALADNSDFKAEYRNRWPDGSVHWVGMRGRVVQSAPGNAVRMAGVTFDATQRREIEETLKDADRRKDEFLATLAHELRNPLAPLRNSLEVLQLTGNVDEGAEQVYAIMSRQVTQMTRLIDDLLDVSRISQGKIELRQERIELTSVLQIAIETSQPIVDEAEHEFLCKLDPQPLYVFGDPTRLAQALSNLINNAAKYTERGGKIELSTERLGSDAIISVRDTGVGIPPELLNQIFDMFMQVERSLERAQGGLGIGLTLVRRLVELHGGKIEAFSDGVNCGSEFRIRLPIMCEERPPQRRDWTAPQ